jgi:hypothetical protein
VALVRARQLSESQWGRQHPKTAEVLHWAAAEAAATGRHDDAAKLYLEVSRALSGRCARSVTLNVDTMVVGLDWRPQPRVVTPLLQISTLR